MTTVLVLPATRKAGVACPRCRSGQIVPCIGPSCVQCGYEPPTRESERRLAELVELEAAMGSENWRSHWRRL